MSGMVNFMKRRSANTEVILQIFLRLTDQLYLPSLLKCQGHFFNLDTHRINALFQ